jgi:hypothetical protein
MKDMERGCCRLFDRAIDLRRAPECHFLEGLNILNPVAHLVAKLQKYRSIRFGAPWFQRGLANPPAFGQFGLGHASFDRHVHPSTGVVRTAMKALYAGKGKWADAPVRKLN